MAGPSAGLALVDLDGGRGDTSAIVEDGVLVVGLNGQRLVCRSLFDEGLEVLVVLRVLTEEFEQSCDAQIPDDLELGDLAHDADLTGLVHQPLLVRDFESSRDVAELELGDGGDERLLAGAFELRVALGELPDLLVDPPNFFFGLFQFGGNFLPYGLEPVVSRLFLCLELEPIFG